MTVVATRKRRAAASEKPQAPRARAGQQVCGAFLRRGTDMQGHPIEQRCESRLHGDDERHRPGDWTDAPIDYTEPF